MKDNPTFSMVNESDEDDDECEDDSETGAMLRPTASKSERTGGQLKYIYQYLSKNNHP